MAHPARTHPESRRCPERLGCHRSSSWVQDEAVALPASPQTRCHASRGRGTAAGCFAPAKRGRRRRARHRAARAVCCASGLLCGKTEPDGPVVRCMRCEMVCVVRMRYLSQGIPSLRTRRSSGLSPAGHRYFAHTLIGGAKLYRLSIRCAARNARCVPATCGASPARSRAIQLARRLSAGRSNPARQMSSFGIR